MRNRKIYKYTLVLLLFIAFVSNNAMGQGPPITADKPIMLSEGTFIAKTLTEYRSTDFGDFTRVPFMLHYIFNKNALVAVHLPFVTYDFAPGFGVDGSGFGDMNVLLKYQFYRKDKTGKTFRVIAKSLQNLPTGEKLDIHDMATGFYKGYYAIVAGYETIKYGISGEVGFNHSPEDDTDELKINLGFGLPLLKPVYPVNQINLYFEYSYVRATEIGADMLLYAQGIQYARKRVTVETAIQIPLYQTNLHHGNRKYSLLFGARYII